MSEHAPTAKEWKDAMDPPAPKGIREGEVQEPPHQEAKPLEAFIPPPPPKLP
jgi:hypothetical protein